MLEEKKVQIKAGERVLIVGETGTGKTLLFRALAGLWPWGAGRVTRPQGRGDAVHAAHALPSSRHAARGPRLSVGRREIRRRRVCKCADRLELGRLVPLLDVSRRWDHELSEDEQHTLAFARALLHAPPWVLIDEVLDSLDDDARAAW